MKTAVFLRLVNHIEALRRLFRNIRHMEGNIKGGSTSKITVTGKDGVLPNTLLIFP